MRGLMNALAPVDAAAARNRGTRNALAELKARRSVNALNRSQDIRQTGQQAAQGGYSTEKHANALRKMGHTNAANKLVRQGQQIEGGELQNRGRELGNIAKGYEVVARTAPLARDQRSWERVKSLWEEEGLAQAGELPDEFDPQITRKLAGKAREKLSASDLVEVQGPDGRPRFVPADMAAGMEPARETETPEYDSTNVVMPGGDVRRGRKTESGGLQVVGDQGKWVDAPPDAYMTGMNVSGSRSDVIDATKPEVRDFRKLEAQMPVVKRLKDRIEEGLGSGSYVGGISGGTLKGLNSLRNQAQQVYRQFNENRPEGERDIDLSVDKFRPALGEVSNMNSKVQSAILSLAYMTLKSRDPSGRVSDNDIKLELDSFGVDTSDPSIIMNRVNEKIGDLFTNYRATAEGLQMEPKYQFNPSDAPKNPSAGNGSQSGSSVQGGQGGQGGQDSSDPLGIR